MKVGMALLLPILMLGLPAADSKAQPKSSHGPTDSELAMLPKACEARLRDNAETKRLWEQRIGAANFMHLHHYCFGLNFVNRARFATDKSQKKAYLATSIDEFNYVLKNWPADSPLRPEAENAKSQAQAMLKLP